jgi:glutamyl-Q tRNA(Asp) synthetase
MHYKGRFAPTPSGDLHFGSLVTALASHLEAHRHQGLWFVRIEDADTPRVKPGSSDSILRALERFGLEWDGLYYQSSQRSLYADCLADLMASGRGYACACSRAQIKKRLGTSGVYDGFCRSLNFEYTQTAMTWRMPLAPGENLVEWEDALQGRQSVDLSLETGDYALQRADGIPSYTFLSVIDDALQGVNHVVRGLDLLRPTAAQIHLRNRLNLAQPRYAHLALAVTPQGLKLSKMAQAKALDWHSPISTLRAALAFLKMPIEQLDARENVAAHLNWAKRAWKMSRLKGIQSIVCDNQTVN